MARKAAAKPKPNTHFEQVPVAAAKRVARPTVGKPKRRPLARRVAAGR
jgi:hypothetical protein